MGSCACVPSDDEWHDRRPDILRSTGQVLVNPHDLEMLLRGVTIGVTATATFIYGWWRFERSHR